MKFRTVNINSHAKLQYHNNSMISYVDGKETHFFLDEISCVIIEQPTCLITTPLIIELSKRNIALIICDEKHNPCSVFLSLTTNYHSSLNCFKQIKWDENNKMLMWKKLVELKIKMQINTLKEFEKTGVQILESFYDSVELGDISNREALAAKEYFPSLFGSKFTRQDQSVINKLLNYGYAIILSCFNRAIVSSGYLTQLGVFHKGQSNSFNLSCDFMEPFRPLVDIITYESYELANPMIEIKKILSSKVMLNSENRFVDDAIENYCFLLFKFLNKESNDFPNLELVHKKNND